jgi:hypothetical protein
MITFLASLEISHSPCRCQSLFDHAIAQARYGASIFWTRPAILIGESVEEFIAYWPVKRGRDRRGIIAVIL